MVSQGLKLCFESRVISAATNHSIALSLTRQSERNSIGTNLSVCLLGAHGALSMPQAAWGAGEVKDKVLILKKLSIQLGRI